MTILTLLSGFLSIDNQPAVDQSVLVIDAKADSILYSGQTDSSGNFSWQYPENSIGSKVYILAKFRTSSIVSAEYTELILSNESKINFNINSNELENVMIELKGDHGIPKNFKLSIDAVSVNGIPENLTRFLSMEQSATVGYYYDHFFDSPNVNLKIKKGTYKLHADFILITRPVYPPAPSVNYIASKAICNGKQLEGGEVSGFKIDIESPLSVAFIMRHTD